MAILSEIKYQPRLQAGKHYQAPSNEYLSPQPSPKSSYAERPSGLASAKLYTSLTAKCTAWPFSVSLHLCQPPIPTTDHRHEPPTRTLPAPGHGSRRHGTGGVTAPGDTARGVTAPGDTARGSHGSRRHGTGRVTAPGDTARGESRFPATRHGGVTAPGDTARGESRLPATRHGRSHGSRRHGTGESRVPATRHGGVTAQELSGASSRTIPQTVRRQPRRPRPVTPTFRPPRPVTSCEDHNNVTV